MPEPKVFIGDEGLLNIALKTLPFLDKQERERLVKYLYPHIEHTRRTSFKNGYDQGKFDEKMDSLNQ